MYGFEVELKHVLLYCLLYYTRFMEFGYIFTDVHDNLLNEMKQMSESVLGESDSIESDRIIINTIHYCISALIISGYMIKFAIN